MPLRATRNRVTIGCRWHVALREFSDVLRERIQNYHLGPYAHGEAKSTTCPLVIRKHPEDEARPMVRSLSVPLSARGCTSAVLTAYRSPTSQQPSHETTCRCAGCSGISSGQPNEKRSQSAN